MLTYQQLWCIVGDKGAAEIPSPGQAEARFVLFWEEAISKNKSLTLEYARRVWIDILNRVKASAEKAK